MPAVQSTYTDRIGAAALGLVVNMETANSFTRVVQDVAGIGFGRPVFQGAADVQITGTPGTAFRGVTIADKTLVRAPGGTVDVYPQYSDANVLDRGVIWVMSAAAVTSGGAVYVTSAGVWTPSASGNTQILRATWEAATDAAGFAKLRLN